ncbi:MAG: L-threonylcarbamoyladenylate synthase [Pseudomonadota bacterium]
MTDPDPIAAAAAILRAGGLVAHATEGVFGLAVDPFNDAAVHRLLALKSRPASKGLIVIGASADVFATELEALDARDRQAALDAWPGAETFVVPNTRFSPLVAGDSGAIAIRVPGHPQARALAAAVSGPLTSTSANPAGSDAAVTAEEVTAYFHAQVDLVIPGEVIARGRPSRIRDLRTGAVLRGTSA